MNILVLISILIKVKVRVMFKTLKIMLLGFKTTWKEKGVEYASYHLAHESVITVNNKVRV